MVIDEEFKRRADAIHEAGHAVAATAMGLRVKQVDVEHDDAGARGHCWYDGANPYPDDATKFGITQVVTGLAGPLAVFKRYGKVRPYQTDEEIAQLTKPDTDTTDWEKLPTDHQTRAFVICDYLLDLHWSNVIGLADEVFELRVIAASSWLQYLPVWWEFPVLADRRQITIHTPDGDVRRDVATHPI